MKAQEELVWGQREQPDVRTGHGAGHTHNGSPASLTARTPACARIHMHTNSHTHIATQAEGGHVTLTWGSLYRGWPRHWGLLPIMVTMMEAVLACD